MAQPSHTPELLTGHLTSNILSQDANFQEVFASQLKVGDTIRLEERKYRLAEVLVQDSDKKTVSYIAYLVDNPYYTIVSNFSPTQKVCWYSESEPSSLDALIRNVSSAKQLKGVSFELFKSAWAEVKQESLTNAMKRAEPLTCHHKFGVASLLPLDKVFEHFSEDMLEQYFQTSKLLVTSSVGSPVYSTSLRQSYYWHFEIVKSKRKGYVHVRGQPCLYELIYDAPQPAEMTYAEAATFLNAVKQFAWLAVQHVA